MNNINSYLKPLLAALALLALYTSYKAEAGTYVTAAIGDNKFNIEPDGSWYQLGLPHHIENQSTSYRLGVGIDINPLVDVELAYENYGQVNGYTWHVSDENYNPNSHNPCLGECEAIRVAYWVGHAKAVTLTALPHTQGQTQLYGRFGAAWYQADFVASNTNLRDANVPEKMPALGYYPHVSNNGISATFGIGMRHKDFYLEYTETPDLRVRDSIFRGVRNIWLGYRF